MKEILVGIKKIIIDGLLIGAPLGASLITIGNTIAYTSSLPRLIYKAYKSLYFNKSDSIGLKIFAGAIFPILIAAITPAVIIGSCIYGLGFGFYIFASDDPKDGKIISICINVIEFKNAINEFIKEEFSDDRSDYKIKTECNFKLTKALKGTLISLLLSPIEILAATIVLILHSYQLIIQLIKLILKGNCKSINDKIVMAALSILLGLVFVLIIPIILLVIAIYSIADAGYNGYMNGFNKTFNTIKKRVLDFNIIVNDFIKSAKEINDIFIKEVNV